jgi:CSLREA domain-containing protein
MAQRKPKTNRVPKPSRARKRRLRKQAANRLGFQALEDRRLLATFTVTNLNDIGSGSLREAIAMANSDADADTIAFSVAGRIDLDSMLPTITETVTIDGAGQITLDAGHGTDGVFGTGDGFRIFDILNSNSQIDVSLRGLTITGGDTVSGLPGGAISSGENLELIDSTVSENATGNGFDNLDNSDINFDIFGPGGDAGNGGGIWSSGTLTLINSTVSGNHTGSGGNALFYGGDGGNGAGIYSLGTVTLTGSTVSGNYAGAEGSGSGVGSVASGGSGGGIWSGSAVTLTGSTVSGNVAPGVAGSGGGIYSKGAVTILQSTVTRNRVFAANSYGGGIWNDNDTITIRNSIVARNTATLGSPDIRPGTGVLDVNYSLIQQSGLSLTGTGNIVEVSPELGQLAFNGGPTRTHAPLPSSPAIDAGDPATISDPLVFDQRGAPFVRVFDDSVASGTGIDMGSFERQPIPAGLLVVDVIDDVINSDFTTGDLSLREALNLANIISGPDTISFSSSLAGQTIMLDDELKITDAVTIDASVGITLDAGDGADGVFGTSDGFRIFNIDDSQSGQIDVTLRGLTLTGGDADEGSLGGAIFSRENLMLIGSTVTKNAAGNGEAYGGFGGNGENGGLGGGIFASGALTLTGSTVSENTAGRGGLGINGGIGGSGGGIASGDTLTLINSTVSGNVSGLGGNGSDQRSGRGGGIWSSRGVTLMGSTVSGNRASVGGNGGGIYSFGGAVTILNSTLTENQVLAATGGGIWNGNDTVTITNSIVAGNIASGGNADIHSGTGALNVNYSLIQQVGLPLVGTGTIVGQPAQLAPLAYNGGQRQTHALLDSSLAIDAGDPTILADPLVFDQRGAPFVRVFDFDGLNGARIDIGAYEHQTLNVPLIVDTAVDENDGDYSAGDLSLREAVGLANGDAISSVISFDPVVFATPQTMSLTLGEIELNQAITIDGPGQEMLTIDAQQQSRIFNISATTGDFTLAGMTLTGGRTTFPSNNTADGGAIVSLTSDNLYISDSTISDSSTIAFGANGGGVYSRGDVTLTSTTVSGNSTAGEFARGGGIISAGDITLTNSTVSGNTTSGVFSWGGGLYVVGDLVLEQSTISGNSTTGNTAYAGGAYSRGLTTISNSTVTDNHALAATSDGGGILNRRETTHITNSIVTGNTAGLGTNDIFHNNETLTVNFSLIGTGVSPDSGTSGNNIVTNDPMLGPLDDNGGPTQTHALLFGSPAINAGDNSLSVDANGSRLTSDQRGLGFDRIDSGSVDIGAYEVQIQNFPTVLIVDSTEDGTDGDYSTGQFTLREAIEAANFLPGADTITFAATVSGSTIALTEGELLIGDDLTITGPGTSSDLVIDAQGNSRVIRATVAVTNLTLDSLTITNGLVTGQVAQGGGILLEGTFNSADLNLTDSTVSGNFANGSNARGGGIFGRGSITVNNSTVSGNTAGSLGGGIFLGSGSSLALTNSTISRNTSGDEGGGVFTFGSAVTVTNSTVSGNTAGFLGGGLFFNELVNPSTLTIRNSIISGNSDSGFAPEFVNPSSLSVQYSIIGDTTGTGLTIGNGNQLNVDFTTVLETEIVNGVTVPLLTDNGGAVETIALLENGPAIDAGNNALAVDANGSPLSFDQRGAGFDRIFGSTVDIGAFEYGSSAFLLGDVNQSGAVDFLDISPFIAVLSSGEFLDEADINRDGTVDFLDISPFITVLSSGGSATASFAQASSGPTAEAEGSTSSRAAEPVSSSLPAQAVKLLEPSETSAKPERRISDGFQVELFAPILNPSLPDQSGVLELNEQTLQPSLLAFVGGGQALNRDDADDSQDETPSLNDESQVIRLPDEETHSLAQQNVFYASDTRAFAAIDAAEKSDGATSAAELFDDQPELLDEILEFPLA